MIGVATSAPQVAFLLVGGAVSDRFPPGRTVLGRRRPRAGCCGAERPGGRGDARLFELCLAGAVIGTATAFASPAVRSPGASASPGNRADQANAIEQFVRPGAIQLAGPALGGIAVALLHPWGSFALDAATFAFSALCVRCGTRRMSAGSTGPRAARTAPEPYGPRYVREGLRYVRGQVWLWGTFLSATFTYLLFIGPTQVLLPYIVRNSLHQGASTYGAVLAVGGAGALMGAVVSGHRRRHPQRPMLWIYGWWTLATLAVAGYGLATNAWGLASAAVVVNGAEVGGRGRLDDLKQRRVVNSMLGRVSSIDWCISTALLPLSYALTAPVAQALGARQTLVAVGVLGAAVTLGFLLLPGMRSDEKRVAVLSSK